MTTLTVVTDVLAIVGAVIAGRKWKSPPEEVLEGESHCKIQNDGFNHRSHDIGKAARATDKCRIVYAGGVPLRPWKAADGGFDRRRMLS